MIRFYTVATATFAVVFLAQLSEDLGLFGHAVWWTWSDAKTSYLLIVLIYVGCLAIVGAVFEAGRWYGRRQERS